MREKGFSVVVLIIAGSLLVIGIIVVSFLSSNRQNVSSKAETIAGLPTALPGSEVKIEIDPLEPINVQDELDNPEVRKIQIKNTNGDLEVSVEEASTSGSGRRGKTDKIVLPNVVITPAAEGLELSSAGVKATTDFPISFNKVTQQLAVEGQNGPRFIRTFPNQAMELRKPLINGEVEKMELVNVPKNGIGDGLAYRITGKKTGNFLGLFPAEAGVEVEVGAQTGLVLGTKEPFWSKFLLL